MVSMHARKRMEAFHEPTHPRPLPGGEQASVRVLSVPLLGGVRGGFMVPMHARKRKEALHERQFISSLLRWIALFGLAAVTFLAHPNEASAAETSQAEANA